MPIVSCLITDNRLCILFIIFFITTERILALIISADLHLAGGMRLRDVLFALFVATLPQHRGSVFINVFFGHLNFHTLVRLVEAPNLVDSFCRLLLHSMSGFLWMLWRFHSWDTRLWSVSQPLVSVIRLNLFILLGFGSFRVTSTLNASTSYGTVLTRTFLLSLSDIDVLGWTIRH